jgi:hypothetical protein
MKSTYLLLLGTALCCLFASLVPTTNAATKTWDGSSSGNWATAANWSGGTLPVAGDDLEFPPGVTRTNMNNTMGSIARDAGLTPDEFRRLHSSPPRRRRK